jgi:hypothetical protein
MGQLASIAEQAAMPSSHAQDSASGTPCLLMTTKPHSQPTERCCGSCCLLYVSKRHSKGSSCVLWYYHSQGSSPKDTRKQQQVFCLARRIMHGMHSEHTISSLSRCKQSQPLLHNSAIVAFFFQNSEPFYWQRGRKSKKADPCVLRHVWSVKAQLSRSPKN